MPRPERGFFMGKGCGALRTRKSLTVRPGLRNIARHIEMKSPKGASASETLMRDLQWQACSTLLPFVAPPAKTANALKQSTNMVFRSTLNARQTGQAFPY